MPGIMRGLLTGIHAGRITRGVFPTSGADPAIIALRDAAVSLWTLDESSGNFVDLIASNDLAVSGTITRTAGKVGNCSQSTSGYLDSIANTGLFPADQSFTFCVWLKFGTIGYQGICGRLDDTNGWCLRTSFSEAIQFVVKTAAAETTREFGALVADTWMFVRVEYDHDAQLMRARVNEGSVLTTSRTVGTGTTSGSFQFHNVPGAAGPGNLSIDEPGMYAGIFTSQMASAIYAAGAGISNFDIATA